MGKRAGIFYGYIVLAAGFVGSLLAWGSYNSFSVLLKPLATGLSLSRETTSSVYSLALIIAGLFSILAGRLSDRLGPKIVLVIGGVLMGVGYVLSSQANSLWQLYLAYGLIMGGGLSCMDSPFLSTIPRWFIKKRGLATGIAKVGVGLGVLVMAPLTGWLVAKYDWRMAFLVIGVLSFVGIVVSSLFIKRDPKEIGMFPDGAAAPYEETAREEVRQVTTSEALHTGRFWFISVIWFMVAFCCMIILGHTAAYASDVGLSTASAAAIVAAIGGFSILGRFGMGVMSDVLGNRNTYIMSTLLMGVSILWLLFARSEWMFYVFAAAYGIAHGSLYTVLTPFLAELFGLGSLGAIFGLVLFIGRLGGALGPTLAGSIYDSTGSYALAYIICVVVSLLTALLLYLMKTPREKTAIKPI